MHSVLSISEKSLRIIVIYTCTGVLDSEQSLFCSKIRRENERDGMRDIRAASGEAASSMGVGRRAKRETALVSDNDLDANNFRSTEYFRNTVN